MSNPYSSPTDLENLGSTGGNADYPIQFSGQVLPEDIRSLFNGLGTLWALLLALLVFFSVSYQALLDAFQRREVTILAAALMISLGTGRLLYDCIWMRMGPGLGKRLQASLPEAFEQKTGQLTEQWISLRTARREIHMLREAIASAATNKEVLWLLYDPSGSDSQFFIPSHFPDGNLAQFKEQIAIDIRKNQRANKGFWTADSGQSDLSTILQRQWPGDGVLAEGVITRGDFLLPPIRNKIQQMLVKTFLSALFWQLTFASAAYIVNSESTLGALVILGASGLILGSNLWKRVSSLGWGVPRKRPVFAIQMQIRPDGVSTSSRFGTTDNHWEAFSGFYCLNDVLAIRMRGTMEAYLILPRRFFSSAEDWQTSRQWLEQNLPSLPAAH